MIDEYDMTRIRNDAYIACDALQLLILAPTLHEDYVKPVWTYTQQSYV